MSVIYGTPIATKIVSVIHVIVARIYGTPTAICSSRSVCENVLAIVHENVLVNIHENVLAIVHENVLAIVHENVLVNVLMIVHENVLSIAFPLIFW